MLIIKSILAHRSRPPRVHYDVIGCTIGRYIVQTDDIVSNNDQPVLFAESASATHAQHPERTEANGCTTARHSVKSDSAVPEDSHDELFTERILATPSLIDPVCTTSKIVPTEREIVGGSILPPSTLSSRPSLVDKLVGGEGHPLIICPMGGSPNG